MSTDVKEKKKKERKKNVALFFSLIFYSLAIIDYLYLFTYLFTAPFPYQMMFMSFNRNTTGVISGAGTANPLRRTCVRPWCFVKFALLNL